MNEVDDFFHRRSKDVIKALTPKPVKHTCPYPPGSRTWWIDWYFPFLHTRVLNTTCLCDINEILESITASKEWKEQHEK